jgi:RNA polymerase sigma-70 factor (ECF subfamily)
MGGIDIRPALVNGQPGAEYFDDGGRLIGVLALDISGGRIQAIRSIINPEKLGHLGPVGDANALVRRIRESR